MKKAKRFRHREKFFWRKKIGGPGWLFSITSHLGPRTPVFILQTEPLRNTPMPRGTSAKNWCFTWNNPSGLIDLDELHDNHELARGIFQEEVGANGTHHLQGYLGFKVRRNLAWLKLHVEDEAHYEIARGTPQDNEEYCSKEDTRLAGTQPCKLGDFTEATMGKRNDLIALRDAVNEGKTFKQISADNLVLPALAGHMPYYNRLTKEMKEPVEREDVKVIFHFGPAGTGKTHCCGDRNPATTYLYDGGDFWEGYTGQTKLILDEFGGHVCTPLRFNRICDKYPVNINIKNGFEWLAATEIHITSNYTPSKWWKDGTKYNREALTRRIHECHHHYEYKRYEKFISDDNGYALDKMLAKINILQI